jgi:hypothetical protein
MSSGLHHDLEHLAGPHQAGPTSSRRRPLVAGFWQNGTIGLRSPTVLAALQETIVETLRCNSNT